MKRDPEPKLVPVWQVLKREGLTARRHGVKRVIPARSTWKRP